MNTVQFNQLKSKFLTTPDVSFNKIMPNLVPIVLEISIKLSENFVIVCVFVQKIKNGKRMGKGRGKMNSCQGWCGLKSGYRLNIRSTSRTWIDFLNALRFKLLILEEKNLSIII